MELPNCFPGLEGRTLVLGDVDGDRDPDVIRVPVQGMSRLLFKARHGQVVWSDLPQVAGVSESCALLTLVAGY